MIDALVDAALVVIITLGVVAWSRQLSKDYFAAWERTTLQRKRELLKKTRAESYARK